MINVSVAFGLSGFQGGGWAGVVEVEEEVAWAHSGFTKQHENKETLHFLGVYRGILRLPNTQIHQERFVCAHVTMILILILMLKPYQKDEKNGTGIQQVL